VNSTTYSIKNTYVERGMAGGLILNPLNHYLNKNEIKSVACGDRGAAIILYIHEEQYNYD